MSRTPSVDCTTEVDVFLPLGPVHGLGVVDGGSEGPVTPPPIPTPLLTPISVNEYR